MKKITKNVDGLTEKKKYLEGEKCHKLNMSLQLQKLHCD